MTDAVSPAPAPEFLELLRARYTRVVYEKNPLAEVICQVRFPRLLSVEAAGPAKLQDAILTRFPLLEEQDSFAIMLGPQGADFGSKPGKSYIFLTQDRRWKFAVSPGSFSLSTEDYNDWNEFSEQLSSVIQQFFNSYSPALLSRVGLRYRDIIDRERLGIGSRHWKNLINPQLLGIMAETLIPEEAYSNSHSIYRWDFETVSLLLQHGFVGRIGGGPSKAYMFDIDYFIEKERPFSETNVVAVAEALHAYAGPLFRWAISDELHNALKPT